MLLFYLSLLETQEEKDRFTNIYMEYREKLVYSAMKILHDPELAEDAVQDVFMHLIDEFQTLPTHDMEQMRRILYRSVHNQAINIQKKRKFEQAPEEESECKEFMREIELDEIMVLRESVDTMLSVLRGMNIAYRLPLEFYYLYESTPKEIAEIMGLTKEAVYKRLSRGHRALVQAAKLAPAAAYLKALDEENGDGQA